MSENSNEGAPNADAGAAPDTGPDLTAEVEKWKSLARKHETDAKAGKAAAARLAEIEAANATDLERAVKAAKDEGRAEVTSKANARLVAAEGRALAAELKFKNPGLALKAVDLSEVKVDDDGEVDTTAIRKALEALAKDEPYLLVEDGPKPPPTFGGGPRQTPPKAEPSMGLGRLQSAYASKTP